MMMTCRYSGHTHHTQRPLCWAERPLQLVEDTQEETWKGPRALLQSTLIHIKKIWGNLPSFKSAMSCEWVEKFWWTMILLTRTSFLGGIIRKIAGQTNNKKTNKQTNKTTNKRIIRSSVEQTRHLCASTTFLLSWSPRMTERELAGKSSTSEVSLF